MAFLNKAFTEYLRGVNVVVLVPWKSGTSFKNKIALGNGLLCKATNAIQFGGHTSYLNESLLEINFIQPELV